MINGIPPDVRRRVLHILEERKKEVVTLQEFSFTGGGCINSGGKLTTSDGSFFLKWNDAGKFPGMFQAEEKGLELLRTTGTVKAPRVIGTAVDNVFQFILLEFIENRSRVNDYWSQLGRQLASLHRVTSSTAGLDHDNYIGSLPQNNLPEKSWIDFFIIRRLEAQLKLLNADKSLFKMAESLYRRLADLLVEEPHSLLHGDLWSGNLIVDENGQPCLIDPAVYFGNREAEISFTLLFGGFDDAFYSAYHEAYPFQPGFRERVLIYNLYPLLVHANLFGGGYLAQVKSILKKYS